MPLITMINRRLYPQFAQSMNTSASQQQFLFQTVFPIAPVKMMGNAAVFFQVILEIGIQQIKLYPSHIHTPDPRINITSREHHANRLPVSFFIPHRGNGDFHKILSFVFGFLVSH